MKKKRDLFADLQEGLEALSAERRVKRTLRTVTVQIRPVPSIAPRALLRLREELQLSRTVFARYLRTNVRTIENWEQGRARPNAQARLLIRLVEKYPDTIARLATV